MGLLFDTWNRSLLWHECHVVEPNIRFMHVHRRFEYKWRGNGIIQIEETVCPELTWKFSQEALDDWFVVNKRPVIFFPSLPNQQKQVRWMEIVLGNIRIKPPSWQLFLYFLYAVGHEAVLETFLVSFPGVGWILNDTLTESVWNHISRENRPTLCINDGDQGTALHNFIHNANEESHKAQAVVMTTSLEGFILTLEMPILITSQLKRSMASWAQP